MTKIFMNVRADSLDYRNQRKVAVYRDVRKMAFRDIAKKVKNLAGERPSHALCARVYNELDEDEGCRVYKYGNCGRKAWKSSPQVENFLERTLLKLRKSTVCTSTSLQAVLMRGKGVKLDTSYIRKILRKRGYRWLPRCQKMKYSPEVAAARTRFAKEVAKMSAKALQGWLAFSMDGVILTIPPKDPTDRHNYCWEGVSNMWRKPGEAAHPELAGSDPYSKQVPLSQAIPLWGGIGPGGFAPVTYHKNKKLKAVDWERVLKKDGLGKAVRAVQRKRVPKSARLRVVCDNEGFLKSSLAKKLYRPNGVFLTHVPKRSPDLNPVEKYWAWLRKELQKKDLQDLKAGRPVLTKAAYRRRVQQLTQTKRSHEAAKKILIGLRGVCRTILKKGRGAASGT